MPVAGTLETLGTVRNVAVGVAGHQPIQSLTFEGMLGYLSH